MERMEEPSVDAARGCGDGRRSLGRLFADLAQDFGLLLRQEMALAKSEIFRKFGRMGLGAGLAAAAGLVALAGLLYLMAAAMMGIAIVLPEWAAALIVGGAAQLMAAELALVGRSRMRAEALLPERTINSLKDHAAWAKEQVQ